MSKADSDNQIGELYSKLPWLNQKIVKCKKELEMEFAKLNNAVQTEHPDEFRIYWESVKQKRKELKGYSYLLLDLKNAIASLEYEEKKAEIMSAVSNCMNLSYYDPLGEFSKEKG